MSEVGLKEVPRIGVFVCHCGVNIGGVVNVPEVVEYAKTLQNVVYSEYNLYMCSKEGINCIKDAIKKHKLNRVVVASCTPRTHGPLFASACEEAGLNKYLFQMVNIREQCSWAHAHEPEEATEKAKYLVRMAVARARLLEPLEELEMKIEPSSLIIGAGISGMTASLSLANQGFKVYLVEKEADIGGIVRKLYKLCPTGLSASEFLHPITEAVKSHKNIKLLTSTIIKDVKGYLGNFEVEALKEGQEVNFKVGTIIVATGAIDFKPFGYYEYGESKNVVTQLELEQLLKEDLPGKTNSVVMIQCVGAMEKRGRTYCSRICCAEAIKNAILIKELKPATDVYILYRDLQAYGKEYEEYYQRAQELGVRFVNFVEEKPPKVTHQDDGNLKVEVYNPLIGRESQINCDLVVLSTPLIQHQDGKDLSGILRVPLGPDEFFLEAHIKLRPVDFSSDGIYLCGTAHGPKDISESVAQAFAVASRASIPMAKGRVKAEAIIATVDLDLCVGCGACAAVCPYSAIELSFFGQPNVLEAACKGCGVCAVECPMGAMQLRHFKDGQMVAAVEGLLTPEKWLSSERKSEPVVVAFACRWCSYAAADLAGIMRLRYPINVRIILVPCSGRVDARHILTAFRRGADGVMVTGCLKGGCHYIDGNIKAEKRIEAIKKVLDVIGIGGDRLEMYFMGAGDADKFVEAVNIFVQRIKELPILAREQIASELRRSL